MTNFSYVVCRVIVCKVLVVMRRVRAAVIHISRWPSYGTARFAPPPATRITLLFPPTRPVCKRTKNIGSSSAPPIEWHRAGRNSNLEKSSENLPKSGGQIGHNPGKVAPKSGQMGRQHSSKLTKSADCCSPQVKLDCCSLQWRSGF